MISRIQKFLTKTQTSCSERPFFCAHTLVPLFNIEQNVYTDTHYIKLLK